MPYSKEVINKVLVRLAKGIDINIISKEFNVSKTTIYRWKKENEDLIEIIKYSIQIRELVKNKKYAEALNICNKEELRTDSVIQSQKINLFFTLAAQEQKQGNEEKVSEYYNEILEICNKEEFEKNEGIQSQKINLFFTLAAQEQEQGNEGKVDEYYNEILEICNKEELTINSVIQSQKINLLITLAAQEQEQGNEEKVEEYYNEILGICNKKEFATNKDIQSQKINLLTILANQEEKKGNEGKAEKYYNEILEICNKKEFRTNSIIQFQKGQIKRKRNNILDKKSMKKNQNKQQMPSVLNSICKDYITLEEIKSMEMSPLEQIIYVVAYYEKYKYKEQIILNFLKSKMKEFKEDNVSLDVLNKLKNRIIRKAKIFDVLFYQNLLKSLPNKAKLESVSVSLKYPNNN